jgi:hypothetical protein
MFLANYFKNLILYIIFKKFKILLKQLKRKNF